MKHLKMFMAGFLALSMGLTACSSEELEDPTTNGDKENVIDSKDAIYSSIRFNIPSSRSGENEGVEVGQDYENKVGSILVVLATAEGENPTSFTYVTHALSDASVSAPGNNNAQHTIVFQDKDEMLKLAEKKVYVFAYCNPTEEIRDYFTGNEDKTNFVDKVCTALTSTWTNDGFLMTNVDLHYTTLPTEAELRKCNTRETAFPLGKVEVIRTAVRFDYKDGSPRDENKTPKYGVNTYPIFDSQVANPTDENLVAKIHMTNVALVNMRNEFFYLPRTSAAGLCPKLEGMETLNTGDYVITPDDMTYCLGLPTEIHHGDANYNALNWDSLDAIVGGKEDTDAGWGDKTDAEGNKLVADKQGYYIWDYTSENTANGKTDTNGKAIVNRTEVTGVIFEAEIDFTGAKSQPAEGATVYLFGNTIYTSIEAIQDEINKAPISNLATAYNKAFTVNEDNTVSPKDDATVEAAGFTIYKPTQDGKYFCYYFYYNRHIDNNDPTATGIMEFATVRNNVYKLSVTGVKKLGTFKPDEEVEDWDAYFSLDVDVKPWVVRVNNIEF